MGTDKFTKLPHRRDMTGEKFGRWTIVGFSHIGSASTKVWKCRCVCGNPGLVKTNELRGGNSRSCGCLQREVAEKTHKTHGMTHSSEYSSWQAMIARCTRKSSISWIKYGGVGISIDSRWLNSFEEFYADMGPKPTPDHSIERRENSKGYCKENCEWATRNKQGRNKGNNRLLTYRGKTQCVTAWSEETGIAATVLYSRIYAKWSDEDCLTTPVRVMRCPKRR